MPELQHIGACVILLNAHGEILLGKRKNNYKAGMFGLPGGKVEINEPLLLAAARELEEETGMENHKFQFIGVVRENQGNYDFIHFVFATQDNGQVPQLREPEKCESWEWINSSKLENVLPGHKAAIDLYLTHKKIADLTQ